MSVRPLKILFIAFGCEPGRGSEPGVGWGFVDEASRRRPVWVITHPRHREAMTAYLAEQHQHHPIHPIYVSLPGLGWLWDSHLGINLYYYLWQLKAGRIGRRLHKELSFDIVQHVSFTRYWMHSAGSRVGAPFIFGPVGGGEEWPPAFQADLTPRERLRERFWGAVRWVMEHDPLLRRTLRNAKATIAGCHHAVEQLRRLGVEPVRVMSAVAPTPQLPPAKPGPGPDDIFRFVSIGRMPKWRGIHLGIRAFAQAFGPGTAYAADAKVQYEIIGEGSEVENLKALAKELGVGDRVHFPGDLPYADCLARLVESAAMIHPSLRDSAGTVFESLSLGVPVVCTDVGTPPLLVDETSGAIISTATSVADVINGFAQTMLRWRANDQEYKRLRPGAIARSKQISRHERGETLEAIYRLVSPPTDADRLIRDAESAQVKPKRETSAAGTSSQASTVFAASESR